jgi:ferric-dicitrate binding protein FerR (iron transport regulator)
LEDLRREYERIKAFISRLEEEHAQGRIEKEVYRKLLEEYKKRLSEVEESLAKAGKTHPEEAERFPRRKYLRYLALGTATAVAAGAYIYQAAEHGPAQRPSTAKTATPISTPSTPTPFKVKDP